MKKKLAWCVFFAGLGGTMTFALYIAEVGWGLLTEVFVWPGLSVLMLGVGILKIRKLERLVPEQFSGTSQLSLIDILVVSCLTGTLLALARVIFEPEDFVRRGITVSLLYGLSTIGGLLTASRYGIKWLPDRVLFSNAYGLRLFGAIGTGAFIIIFLTILCHNGGRVSNFVGEVFSWPDYVGERFDSRISLVMRLALIALPFGLAGCAFARRSRDVSK